MILGLTGNIASGKSTVARELERRGAVVVDADQLAREVVAPGSDALRQLVEVWGDEILQADGQLDREMMGRKVFADSQARKQLNEIVHPAIARLSVQRLQQLRQENHPLIIYEAPLLYEAGAQTRVDKVLVVTVTPEVQMQRLLARDGLDETQARQRMESQMPQEQKVALADYCIDNSCNWAQTLEQIDELWKGWLTDGSI